MIEPKDRRTVRVEDTRNANVDTVLAVEAVGEGLCNALTFVVACTRTDGVDMPPAIKSIMTQQMDDNGPTH